MNKCWLYYSYVHIFVCWSAEIVFLFVYGNIQGGIWAMAAALTVMLCAMLHTVNFSEKLLEIVRGHSLYKFNFYSVIMTPISFAFTIWYAFTMIYWKISFSDYQKTAIFPCVFSFITGKWCIHLYMTVKEYSEAWASSYSSLDESV